MSIGREIVGSVKDVRNSSRNFLDNLTGNLLIEPTSDIGVGGFLFDLKEEEKIDLTNTITRSAVEDGSNLTDHVINEPIEVSFKGKIVDVLLPIERQGFQGTLDRASQIVNSAEQFLPSRTASQTQKIRKAIQETNLALDTVDKTISEGENFLNLFDNASQGGNSQSKAYSQLYSLYKTRQPIRIQTDTSGILNVIFGIDSISMVKSNRTFIDVSITCSEIRLAKVKTVPTSSLYSGAEGSVTGQLQNQTSKGKVATDEVSEEKKQSLLSKVFN